MSPSLASSSAHSNTSSPSATHHPLPMALSQFLPRAAPRWSPLAFPSEFPTPSVTSFSTTLAVPVPTTCGRVGSPFDVSPSPSVRSNCDLGSLDQRPSTVTFLSMHSRVVKVRRDPNTAFVSLRSIFDFLGESAERPGVGSPLSMWTLKDFSTPDDVWIVFRSHHDACLFLSLSLPSFTLYPALEADLEPFEKLRRVDLPPRLPPLPVIQPERKSHKLRMSMSTPDLHDQIYVGQSSVHNQPSPAPSEKFIISSNPPNPRTTFRVGDWICNSATCAAHNFGRNLACRGCGCPRSESQVSSISRQVLGMPSARLPASPRFTNAPGATSFYPSPSIPNPTPQHGARYPLAAQPVTGVKPASPSHPLLTPSGRSFSMGGKVQNISTEPSAPCIMYWPDNEPFPEQGQIRPSNLSGLPQPPILNTGNRGPIEHQPGDWICQKCNYLNWRRRKVCQTCYPYAEGNGDSISAAVQSERINLLTSLLAQNQLPLRASPSSVDAPRRNTVTQVQHHHSLETITPPSRHSRSQIDIRTTAQYPESQAQFIYETSGPHQHALPLFPGMQELEDGAPAPLLPSFLQDIVQSPTLSPTSTSSADLSEEYDDIASFGRDGVVARDDSALKFHLGNIWRLNDEETTNAAGIALPHHGELVGSRKNSQEIIRRQSP